MGKRKTNLNVALVLEPATAINFTDADWSKIASKYGHKLLPDVRQAVLEATQQYLEFAPGEDVAEPVKEARDRVERTRKAGLDFMNAVQQMGGPRGQSHAQSLVFQRFGNDAQKLNLFFEMMTSLKRACELALDEINDPNNHGWLKGSTWTSWIRRLTDIMQKNKLPYGVRKDAGKNKTGKPSDFVAFVQALQVYIPARYRLHSHSPVALENAIYRSRASGQEAHP